MGVAEIEKIILAAKTYEFETNQLETKLIDLSNSMPKVISLPQQEPERALLRFVVEYIDHVPLFLTAVSIAAKEAGIEDYVLPFLQVADQYFTAPLEDNEGEEGLIRLMNQAYLSHRLIEEVNDQYILRAGIPLIPMDITKSNIIVHHLIGEQLANSLDDVVEETAKQMVNRDSVYSSAQFKEYVDTRKGVGWKEVWKQWADMTRSLDIDLDFENSAADSKVH
ncbi:MAG: hypothetical protein COC19_00620 [SAR86 cluster bacterium]|uniref:Uncharacterized protein n=1 Tax=SAR86 cluster bacterium TaxID=2030880 RepID=A0A2A4MV21_9GAMM|nr:MAG: hypothetical protein COC19_00620 [SAR86 cluster bacterium]